MDNMREVEMRTAQAAKNKAAEKPTLDFETRKKLQRAVQNAERKIEKLEKDIETFELKMANPEFYNQPDSDKEIEKYQQLKKDLDVAMEAWEEATEALGE